MILAQKYLNPIYLFAHNTIRTIAMGLSYKKTADFYASVPATIDGVLGGFGYLSDPDINASKAFLDKAFALQNPPGTELALDCGAGIGRVTKNVLLSRFDKVDLLEQEQKFINAAKQSIGKDNAKLGTIYHNSLHKFKFEKGKFYDAIWCQWILCHISDIDIVVFLNKCRSALKDNGIVVVKENVNKCNWTDFDEEDSSITRPVDYMIELFKDAHLKVVDTEIQEDFPEDFYPVHSFLLVPSSQESIEINNSTSISTRINNYCNEMSS